MWSIACLMSSGAYGADTDCQLFVGIHSGVGTVGITLGTFIGAFDFSDRMARLKLLGGLGLCCSMALLGEKAITAYLLDWRPTAPTLMQGTVVDLPAVGALPHNVDRGPDVGGLTITIVSADHCAACVADSPRWAQTVYDAVGLSQVAARVRFLGLGGVQLTADPLRELRSRGLTTSSYIVPESELNRFVFSTGVRTTPLFILTDQRNLVRAVASKPSAVELANWLRLNAAAPIKTE